MMRRTQPLAELMQPLFPEVSVPTAGEKRQKRYKRFQPIWTEDKAKFIQQYLKTFVYITKNGAYIDGFAGPQYPDHLDAWAAALVLQSEPKWLRHFFLCEIKKDKIKALEKLKAEQPVARDKSGRKLSRSIFIYPGDFNVFVHQILASGMITQKEATFCLLDQHTFECHWATLETLAAYKKPPNRKIELLYFLGVGWLHRALAGKKNTSDMEAWWGGPEWEDLPDMSAIDIADLVRKRFESELGYKSAAAYPIFDSKETNRVMYYMIHASDHDDATGLMVRAHGKAVRALPRETQRPLPFKP